MKIWIIACDKMLIKMKLFMFLKCKSLQIFWLLYLFIHLTERVRNRQPDFNLWFLSQLPQEPGAYQPNARVSNVNQASYTGGRDHHHLLPPEVHVSTKLKVEKGPRLKLTHSSIRCNNWTGITNTRLATIPWFRHHHKQVHTPVLKD